ncbi:DUF1612 domain-containing protein [Aquamicrobium ahrensii]|uniref:DUF1612 domain-containing protein n=1 Tax=Aquamicrobium ahrensii TaxID=469551 RepID=UPI00339334E8
MADAASPARAERKSLSAAILYDAWGSLVPIENQHWSGGHLVSVYLRGRGSGHPHVSSSALAFFRSAVSIPSTKPL